MAKILTADDSVFMRKILIKILNKMGYEDIIEADNGDEALELYQEENPDLVLLDIVMKGKYGMDVLKELMKINPDARVIMVSAVGQESIVEEAMQIGAKNFISKPFKEEKVIEIITEVMEA
ncbi:MAG: two-component system response regulator [Candidatus Altiarchaeales archaeon ex4484_96]|nr:MAG: two-component system response regulator [Candidatus Altiarchaeales archaeon ex4484_96]